MPLDIDFDASFETADALRALITAVRDAAPAEPEQDWIEWKSTADLSTRPWHASLSKQIAGSANRDPDRASEFAGGFAYILVGVEPGALAGVAPIDPAQLRDGIGRFVDSARVRWRADYVEFEGVSVLALIVDPPRVGDRIVAILRDFQQSGASTRLRIGDVYVHDHGQTRLATQTDLDMLTARAAATPQPNGWWEKPGAPRFHLNFSTGVLVGGSSIRLSLEKISGDDLGALSARYRAFGAEPDFGEIGLDASGLFRVPSVEVQARSEPFDDDVGPQEVGFELRFWWDEAYCHVLYVWPLVGHPKGMKVVTSQDPHRRWATAE